MLHWTYTHIYSTWELWRDAGLQVQYTEQDKIVRARGWGDMRTHGLVDERKYTEGRKRHRSINTCFFQGIGVSSCDNNDWCVRNTLMFPGRKRLGHRKVCNLSLLGVLDKWLDKWCWHSDVALMSLVAIGTITSHADQLTWRWKHSHLKCSVCFAICCLVFAR